MKDFEKILDALSDIQNGITAISEVISENAKGVTARNTADDGNDDEDKKSSATKGVLKKNGISRKEKESSEEIPDGDDITEENLKGLSFNNLRKLAKKLDVDTTGDRKSLVERILKASGTSDDEADEEKPAKKTADSGKKSPIKMGDKKKPVVEEDDDEDEDDSDSENIEDDADDDDIEEMVAEAVKDMSTEEIADYLADSGIKAKGKRETLIAAVVKAVRDGVIELEDDGEDEEDTEDEEEKPSKKSSTKKPESDDEDDEDEDEDDDELDEDEYDINDPDNPKMTVKRKKALKKLRSQIEDEVDEDGLDELRDLAVEHNILTEKRAKKADKDELLEIYFNLRAALIDDEGNEVDPDDDEHEPYEINGVPYCCGEPLEYDKKHNSYKCAVCGNEYSEE